MQKTPVNQCRLPDWFDKATLDDQVALVVNCTVVNAASAREAAAKQACLTDYLSTR